MGVLQADVPANNAGQEQSGFIGIFMVNFYNKKHIFLGVKEVSSSVVVFLSLALVACGSIPHPDLNVKAPPVWRNSVVSTSLSSAYNEAWWNSLKDPLLNLMSA